MAKVIIDEISKRYYDDIGRFHREDGPAIISTDGRKAWYVNGDQSSSTHPTLVDSCGMIWWEVNDELHRETGPAWDEPNGNKKWCKENGYVWPVL